MTEILSKQIEDKLYKLISSGEFEPGSQLPGENELSARFGVSRSTLREAIRSLSAAGVLTVQRGKGTFVSENFRADMPDVAEFNLRKSRVSDLFEARLIFEPDTAALACRRASDTEIEEILALGKQVEEAIQSGRDRTELDQQFHKAIVSAAHNEFLKQLLPIINSSVSETIALRSEADTIAADTLRDHAMLMEFFADRNATGVKNAMVIHIVHAMKTLGLNVETDSLS